MSEKSNPNVSKLLRVLVAGGVALAGAAGTRAADKDTASTEATKKAQDKDQEQQKAKADADKEKAEKEKKKAEAEKKARSEEGGGVKGW